MWPFDYIYQPLSSALDAANQTIQVLLNLPYQMAALILQILQVIFYPAVALLDVLQVLVNAALAPPLQFVNALITIPNAVIQVLNLLTVGVFPSAWIGLLVSGLLIVLGLRLYAIVKGVTILGNSI